MPEAISPQAAADARNAIHAEIIRSTRPDARYGGSMTNVDKVDYICACLNYDAGAFDLDVPFPIEDWAVSDDTSLVCSGLYLNDMRVQLYGRIMGEQASDHPLFIRHAQAEYWQAEFNKLVHRRQSGSVIRDKRTLH